MFAHPTPTPHPLVVRFCVCPLNVMVIWFEGVTKFCFDLFGDTVNTAARMCSYCDRVNGVLITDAMGKRIDSVFNLSEPMERQVKGKGKAANF